MFLERNVERENGGDTQGAGGDHAPEDGDEDAQAANGPGIRGEDQRRKTRQEGHGGPERRLQSRKSSREPGFFDAAPMHHGGRNSFCAAKVLMVKSDIRRIEYDAR